MSYRTRFNPKNIAFTQNFPNFSFFSSIWGSRCYKPPKIGFECSSNQLDSPKIQIWISGIQTVFSHQKHYFYAVFFEHTFFSIHLGFTLLQIFQKSGLSELHPEQLLRKGLTSKFNEIVFRIIKSYYNRIIQNKVQLFEG